MADSPYHQALLGSLRQLKQASCILPLSGEDVTRVSMRQFAWFLLCCTQTIKSRSCLKGRVTLVNVRSQRTQGSLSLLLLSGWKIWISNMSSFQEFLKTFLILLQWIPQKDKRFQFSSFQLLFAKISWVSLDFLSRLVLIIQCYCCIPLRKVENHLLVHQSPL